MNNTGNKNSLLLFIGSVSFVLLGVFVIAFIGLSPGSNSSGGSQDIRAKAGVVSTSKLIGVVDTIDETAGTIKVNNLKFESTDNPNATLGTWTVKVEGGIKSDIVNGVKVRLSILPGTMKAKTHTVTATAVEIIR